MKNGTCRCVECGNHRACSWSNVMKGFACAVCLARNLDYKQATVKALCEMYEEDVIDKDVHIDIVEDQAEGLRKMAEGIK